MCLNSTLPQQCSLPYTEVDGYTLPLSVALRSHYGHGVNVKPAKT